MQRRRTSSASSSSIHAATAAAASALQLERRRSSELDPGSPFSGGGNTGSNTAVAGDTYDDNDDHSEEDSGDEALVPSDIQGRDRRISGSLESLQSPTTNGAPTTLHGGTWQRLRSASLLSDGGASVLSGDYRSLAGDGGDEYNSDNDDNDECSDDEDEDGILGLNLDEAWAAAPLLRTDVEVCVRGCILKRLIVLLSQCSHFRLYFHFSISL